MSQKCPTQTDGIHRKRQIHSDRLNNAATRIQSVQKGIVGRQNAREYSIATRAAIRLQKIIRGRTGREDFAEEKRKTLRVVPKGVALDALRARSEVVRTVGDWQEYRDRDTGSYFYYQTYTFESQWAPPPAFSALLNEDEMKARATESHDHVQSQIYNAQMQIEEQMKLLKEKWQSGGGTGGGDDVPEDFASPSLVEWTQIREIVRTGDRKIPLNNPVSSWKR